MIVFYPVLHSYEVWKRLMNGDSWCKKGVGLAPTLSEGRIFIYIFLKTKIDVNKHFFLAKFLMTRLKTPALAVKTEFF